MMWYVLKCKAYKDKVAEMYLTSSGENIYRPILHVGSIIDKTFRLESMFPWYIFINTDDVVSTYHSVKYTPGVVDFLRFGSRIPSITDEVITEIKNFEKYRENHYSVDERKFKKGASVEILRGSFANIPCEFCEYRGSQRAAVLLNILNSKREVEVDNRDLKAV